MWMIASMLAVVLSSSVSHFLFYVVRAGLDYSLLTCPGNWEPDPLSLELVPEFPVGGSLILNHSLHFPALLSSAWLGSRYSGLLPLSFLLGSVTGLLTE